MAGTYAFHGNGAVGAALGARLEAAGFELVESLSDAAVIVTYCTSQTALEDAYFDAEGLVQRALPGTVLVDLSASTPSFARELGAVATVSDLAFVEAPLVVHDQTLPDAFGSRDNLACFVAGEDGVQDRALPLLEAVAGTVHATGAAGSAQLARAAYSLQNTAQLISAIEADALYHAVSRGSAVGEPGDFGRAGAITEPGERLLAAVHDGRFSGTYTVEMFMAELSAALMAADDVDLILPQAEACMYLLELLAVIGGSDKAPASLALVYGEEADCAANGLDWTRAEQAYGEEFEELGEYDGLDDDCGHDHDHDPYEGLGFSAN